MSRFNHDAVPISASREPKGKEGDNWHRYVIANEVARITGYRTGIRKEVTE